MILTLYILGSAITAVFALSWSIGFSLRPFGLTRDVHVSDIIITAVSIVFSWFTIVGVLLLAFFSFAEASDNRFLNQTIIRKEKK